MKQLQGVTSNPQPIVSDRGVGEARALSGLASDIRGLASMQATTSTKGLPEDKQAEILSAFQQEDQALWASIQQRYPKHKQMGAYARERKMLVSSYIASTPDEGLHKVFIQTGNDYDDPDMAMAKALQEQAVQTATKYGLDLNKPEDNDKLRDILKTQQQTEMDTLEYNARVAADNVTKRDEQQYLDSVVDSSLTNFDMAVTNNMSLLPDGSFGGVNEGLSLPPLGTAMTNNEEAAQIAAVFDARLDHLATQLRTNSKHLTEEEITNALKPVKAKHDLYLKSLRGGYTKEQYEAAAAVNNAAVNLELSDPAFQMAQRIVDNIKEMDVTSRLAYFKKYPQHKKAFEDAIALTTNTLLGNKVPLTPDTQQTIPLVIEALVTSDELSEDDAAYLTQTLIPSISPDGAVVKSAKPLSDEHLQSVMKMITNDKAKANMEKHPALKEAVTAVAVDYTNKLLKANFESLDDNLYYDYDSRTIKVHEGADSDPFSSYTYKLRNEAREMNASPLLAKMHKSVDALAGLTGDDPAGIIQAEIGGTVVGEGIVQQEGQPDYFSLSAEDQLNVDIYVQELGIPRDEAIGYLEKLRNE